MAGVYSLNQVAEKLKVSKATVRKLINEDKLKALKVGNRYVVNEISLLVFKGHRIEECINKEQFEEYYSKTNELYDEKVDKEKFYEYYCSLFTPGPDLPSDYFLIDEPTPIDMQEDYSNKTGENKNTEQVQLTRDDIVNILENLNNIQQILQSKIK